MSGVNDNHDSRLSYEENDNEPKSRGTAQAYLFAFDFDHTIINLNSDYEFPNLIDTPLPESISDRNKEVSFIEYMNSVFRFLHSQNASIADLREFIRKLEPTKGMVSLLTSLVRYKQSQGDSIKLLVISDSNDLTISEWLKAQIIDRLPSTPTQFPFDVITNTSIIHETEGLLQVKGYEHQTSCRTCPSNLCKGSALKKYTDLHGPFTRTFYVGDGFNDICPTLNLSSQCFVFPRINYYMYKWLQKDDNKKRLKANIVFWDDANVIHNTIRSHVVEFK
ncbi:unnamed protein product [Orchesella dallaii]|uniref:Pyridoxal phosphate phosphatase PHOSPHO2 n=1 Tax=Orchesella dallaii TaxID=48710 RepID=A0ABP1R137_9HEXA